MARILVVDHDQHSPPSPRLGTAFDCGSISPLQRNSDASRAYCTYGRAYLARPQCIARCKGSDSEITDCSKPSVDRHIANVSNSTHAGERSFSPLEPEGTLTILARSDNCPAAVGYAQRNRFYRAERTDV